jgi:hypothetical protein
LYAENQTVELNLLICPLLVSKLRSAAQSRPKAYSLLGEIGAASQGGAKEGIFYIVSLKSNLW